MPVTSKAGRVVSGTKGDQMILAVLSLVVGLVAAPADVTGKWDGKISGQRPDGAPHDSPALLILQQKGTTITGSIGGDENDRHAITSGTIEDNKVTILAKNDTNGREFRLELVLDGDTLSGMAYSGDEKVKVQVRRRKE